MSTDPTLSSDGANRRRFLGQIGGGFGSVALTQMLSRDVLGNGKGEFNGGLHHRAKVRRVIQLFMTGGASPMDTFDYKPELERLHGQKLGPSEKPEGFTAVPGALMKSPFKFKQHGQSGRWVSEVFPHQAKWVDEMAFLMAMSSKTNVHGPGTYMMNSGFLLPGFPCLGAWTSYALGNSRITCPPLSFYLTRKVYPTTSVGPFQLDFCQPFIKEPSSTPIRTLPFPISFPKNNSILPITKRLKMDLHCCIG